MFIITRHVTTGYLGVPCTASAACNFATILLTIAYSECTIVQCRYDSYSAVLLTGNIVRPGMPHILRIITNTGSSHLASNSQ